MADPEESLKYPSADELQSSGGPDEDWMNIREAKDLSTDEIIERLAGMKFDPLMDVEDLKEVLLRRQHESSNQILGVQNSYLLPLSALFLVVFAFFGWKLYKSLKEKEKKREDKKKLKQKKKK